MATIRQLPTSPRTTVYRKVCQILQTDPVLSSVIRPESFRTWAGRSHDNMEFSYSSAPGLRLTPLGSLETWKFPEARVGDLVIRVDMVLPGTDADDEMNLWWAIQRAIYPDVYATQLANIQALQAAGANTGYVEFSQPAFDPEPQDRFFVATGQMKIEVRLQLQG